MNSRGAEIINIINETICFLFPSSASYPDNQYNKTKRIENIQSKSNPVHSLLLKNAAKANYQKKSTNSNEKQYTMLKNLELNYASKLQWSLLSMPLIILIIHYVLVY